MTYYYKLFLTFMHPSITVVDILDAIVLSSLALSACYYTL